jgi:hypothetical protein
MSPLFKFQPIKMEYDEDEHRSKRRRDDEIEVDLPVTYTQPITWVPNITIQPPVDIVPSPIEPPIEQILYAMVDTDVACVHKYMPLESAHRYFPGCTITQINTHYSGYDAHCWLHVNNKYHA